MTDDAAIAALLANLDLPAGYGVLVELTPAPGQVPAKLRLRAALAALARDGFRVVSVRPAQSSPPRVHTVEVNPPEGTP